jgi:heme a synthase
MALQGAIGIVQFQLELPAEILWIHLTMATLLWVGIVVAAMEFGAPSCAPAPETVPEARSTAMRS